MIIMVLSVSLGRSSDRQSLNGNNRCDGFMKPKIKTSPELKHIILKPGRKMKCSDSKRSSDDGAETDAQRCLFRLNKMKV